MAEEAASDSSATAESLDSSTVLISKSAKHSYTRNYLLSLADHESCKRRPDGIDSVLWRDCVSVESIDGGIVIPPAAAKGLVRRDRESDGYSKSPQDIPEWRKDSWRPGSSGSSGSVGIQQGPRRKLYDDDMGNAFSTSYPPRPVANWGENGHVRVFDRLPGVSSSGLGRWEHRPGVGERERDRRPFHDWETDDFDTGNRPFVAGTSTRAGWVPLERDGLLGSGGGLRGSLTSGSPGNSVKYNGIGRNGRSNDQYQPPRQVKTSSYTRREETDFVNHETFGFDESSNEERAEQERKRRESFELMRKQHQKQLQEQKLLKEKRFSSDGLKTSRKHDENSLWDGQTSPDSHANSPPKSPDTSFKFETATSVVTSNVKVSLNNPPTPRPAVPPGFTKAQLKSKPKNGADGNLYMEEDGDCARQESNAATGRTSDANDDARKDAQVEDISLLCTELDGDFGEISVGSSQNVNVVKLSEGNLSRHTNDALDKWSYGLDNGLILSGVHSEDNSSDVPVHETFGRTECSQNSVLDELFGKARKDGSISNSFLVEEENASYTDKDTWSVDPKMSKFAQWFHTEDGSAESIVSNPPSVHLRMPKSGESAPSSLSLASEVVSEALQQDAQVNPLPGLSPKSQVCVLPMPPGPSLADIEKGIATSDIDVAISATFNPFKAFGVLAEVDSSQTGFSTGTAVVPKLPPVFLTCEDIELSIIAEADGKGVNICTATEPHVDADIKLRESSSKVCMGDGKPQSSDGQASRYLLSLLHRRPSIDTTEDVNVQSTDVRASRLLTDAEKDVSRYGPAWEWTSEDHEKGKLQAELRDRGEYRTLESLFGKAFMIELRAQDKPVSLKSCSDEQVTLEKADGSQAVLSAMSFNKHSPGGNNGISKPSYGTIGRTSRPMLSVARNGESHKDMRVMDLFARKPPNQIAEVSVSLSAGGVWPNDYPPNAQAQKRLTSSDNPASIYQAAASEIPLKVSIDDASESDIGKTMKLGQGVCNTSDYMLEGALEVCTEKEQTLPMKVHLRDLVKEAHIDAAAMKSGSLREPVTGTTMMPTPSNLVSDSSVASEDVVGKDDEENLNSMKCSFGQSPDKRVYQDGNGGKATPTVRKERSFDGIMVDGLSESFGSKGKAVEVLPSASNSSAGGYGSVLQSQPRAMASQMTQLRSSFSQSHQGLVYSGFQPVMQHPQSGLPMAAHYRPFSSPLIGLHSRPAPLHHQLQQPLVSQGLSPGGYSGFSQQSYRAPQLQQQMQPHYGIGNTIDFPHFGFGPIPDNGGRPFPHGSASGAMHFQPPPPGHLGQGAYPQMGPMGPVPNQFMATAQVPQRGPFFQAMNGGPFIDHSLHEPHGFTSKQGQQGVPIFSMNGPSLHSAHGAMFHQTGHSARPQPPGQLVAGHPPAVGFIPGIHYGSDLGHGNKGHDMLGYTGSNGNMAGSPAIDRWFGADVNRNNAGTPGHGLIQ